jgi:CRP/FNR family transcriptional regulator, anaerobic regulatory protein
MTNQIASSRSPSFLKCGQCSLGSLCLPVGLTNQDMGELEHIVDTIYPYSDDAPVYTAGQTFDKIYAVKSGMFKSVIVDSLGNDHITGFHLPGELFGLDAIYSEKYMSSAVSLGTSSLCAIDYSDLEQLSHRLPSLQHQLMNLMSKEVRTSQSLNVDLTADQKLAGFLVALAARYKERGYSETRFHLVMPRRDIANHLNMAPETVSRLFKRFSNEGLLDINRTDLTIVDLPALKEMSGCAATK